MTTYSYRKADPGEWDKLRDLTLRAYGQHAQTLGQEGWLQMQKGLLQRETYTNLLSFATCFVCESEAALVGMVFLIPSGHPAFVFEKDWSYIRLLGVDPAHCGAGIGRRLTKMCVEEAQSKGERILALHTSEFQDAARHIYDSMGFRRMRELDPIYGKRYWLYLRRLDLHYREAGNADIETLIDLRVGFSLELLGTKTDEEIRSLRNSLRIYLEHSIAQRSSIWFLAYCGDQIAGTGCLVLRDQPPGFVCPNGRMGYLFNMYTLPAWRGLGICHALVERLIAAGKELGIRFFELHATKAGEPVYQNCGFKLHPEPTYRLLV